MYGITPRSPQARPEPTVTDVYDDTPLDRRRVLAATGTVLAGALAGCSGGGDGGDGNSDGGDSGDGGDGGGGSTDFGGWFDDVSNFDGVVDETGADEVTVKVGAEGNGANYAFSPAAVKVSSGTTVIWEWTGKGSTHNVVHDGGDYESELVLEKGHTFEHTFESAGTSKYSCVPHEALGMKGAVVVE